MNRNEFEEFQAEMVDIVVSYEQFCKKGYLLDLKYNYNFYDYIIKEHKLKTENQLLYDVMVQIDQNKNKEDIEKYILKIQENYNQTIVGLSQKNQYAKGVIQANQILSNEVIDEFEREFKEFCSKHHPAIRFFITSKENVLYEQLRRFYYENNYSAFTAFLQMNQNNLKSSEVTEEQINEISTYYYQIMEKIKLDINERKNQYPYLKESVFDDELSIASEEAEFRVKLNRLLGMNKSLHKDFIDLYGKDIHLS